MNLMVMFRMTVLAIATSMASLAGGVALGGYTVGGFRMQAPPDGWREDYGRYAGSDGETMITTVAAAGPTRPHVCKGCDAGLHRDDWHYASYDGGSDPYAYDDSYDDYRHDPDRDGTEAWDAVPQTADPSRFAQTERSQPPHRNTVKAGLHETAVDWPAVMDAYGVSLPVVTRTQPANTSKRPAAAPVTVVVPTAAVVNVAALEVPAATTIEAHSETTVGLRRP